MEEHRREDWLVREQFRVVRVSSLPYFHDPFKCVHKALFEVRESDDADEAGHRFFDRLTDKHFRTCDYHQRADWRVVAQASVRLFRDYRDQLKSRLATAVMAEPISERDRFELSCLFDVPIVWRAGSQRVRDGQHRICAIQASGARVCTIDHDRFSPYDPAPDYVRQMSPSRP